MPDLATMNLSVGITPEEAARIRARAEVALRAVLTEPVVRYANVRSVPRGAICGEVETSVSGIPTGLRPFVVAPGGDAIVSATPSIRLGDPTDPFPDLYMEYCASPDELRSIAQRMEGMQPSTEQPAEMPVPGAISAPPEPEDVDPADEPFRERVEPRHEGDDSFFNAVVRPPRNATPPG